MDLQELSRWRPTSRQVRWTVGIIVALVGAYIFLRFAYVHEWKWTGLVKHANYHKRTLWDWLQLLIIPAVIAGGTIWFNRRQQGRAEQSAEQRAQDDALQAYLDQMSQLLIEKDLHTEENQYVETRVTARARTLVVLRQLDDARKDRKRGVLQFLYEAQLINKEKKLSPLSRVFEARVLEARVIRLDGAELRNASLRYITLSGAALDGAILENADLSNTYLSGIDLGGSYLSGADLSSADLRGASLVNAELQRKEELSLGSADLGRADLSRADLSGAYLRGTNLGDAKLANADLQRKDARGLEGANLGGADLTGADLTGADLSGAIGVTAQQLRKCKSLEDATMPNGQKYKDWLKDKKVINCHRDLDFPLDVRKLKYKEGRG
jgi:uncharacterized protein YjbI with pentapeptide repeats